MSNTNDPKKPAPGQPDPNAPKPPAPGGYVSGGSSFEFQLPNDIGPFSELPPVSDPNAGGPSRGDFTLPPPPEGAPRSGASFDFINLPASRGSFGDFGLDPVPLPPPPDEAPAPEPPAAPLIPTDYDVALPELPPPAAGDSATLLEAALAEIEPVEAEPIELTEADVVDAEPVDAEAIDLADEAVEVEAAPADLAPGSGASDILLADALPAAEPASAVRVGEDLPAAEQPSSFTLGSGKPGPVGSVPDVALLFPGSAPELPPAPAFAVPPFDSTPEVAAPAAPSGSTPQLPSVALPGSTGSTPELPTYPRAHSSFEFQLPEGVESVSEMKLPAPDAPDVIDDYKALPPPPVAGQRTGASFDFINLGGGRAFSEIDIDGKVVSPAEPAAEAPPAAPAAADSKVGLDNLEPIEPVLPASGWLDSEALEPPAELPGSDPLADALVAEPIESSDIFSGPAGRTPASDAPARPSEVALTFDAVPGDEASDLPLAEEAIDSGTALAADDGESIHDQAAPNLGDPLFDSATLADAPEVPDAHDYGAPTAPSADASSILAELSAPATSDGDSSSVRVEAPGMNRTLAGRPSDVAFDLTVPDEPVPADLLDSADDGTANSTAWADPSGPNLTDKGNTASDIDLGDPVEAVDADPEADMPSSASTGSAPSARIGRPPADQTADDADVLAYAALTDNAADGADRPGAEGTDAAASDPAPSTGDLYFHLPTARDADDVAIDWDAAEVADDDNATRGATTESSLSEVLRSKPPGASRGAWSVPTDASLSSILRGERDDSAELQTGAHFPQGPGTAENEPAVSVDWLAGSVEEAALAEPLAFSGEANPEKTKPTAGGKDKDRKDREPEAKTRTTSTKGTKARAAARGANDSGTGTAVRSAARKGGRGGLFAGLVVGGLLAGGAFAGVYYGGVIPNGDKAPVAKAPQPGPDGKVEIDGRKYVPEEAGTKAPAVDPRAAFAAGETAKALDHLKANPPQSIAEKAEAGHIRVFAKVQALKDGAAASADDPDLKAARAELEAVTQNASELSQPGGTRRAVKAAVALGVAHEIAGDFKAARKVYTDSMEKYPAYKSTFEALIDKLDALQPAAPAAGTMGAGRLHPEDAARLLFAVSLLLQDGPKGEEPEPGVYYWKAVNLAAGGKYAEAVKQIEQAKAAHAARARAVAGRGVNPLSDPLEQIFTRSCDELKAYWELRGAIYGNPAVAAAVKKDGLVKALDNFAKAENDLGAAQAAVKKLEGDVAKLDKDAKAFEKGKADAETKVADAEKKLETAATDLKAAQKAAQDQKDALAGVADALKPAAALPEKWVPADLIAATKAAATRATGPDLRNLVPNAMIAIGGGGLATGQLLDLADRLNKAETAAKVATDKLAADTKKLSADHATALKTLKDAGAEEVKRLTDKHAVDVKKLTDDHAAATDKLKTEHAAAIKGEQATTEGEKKKAALREIELQKQLANAVTPSQFLDIWLGTLTDLRRPTDGAPALAAADKALASSPPDSEDAAKARTVAGLAHLLRGDTERAQDSFQAARRGPAYQAAAGKKFWARVADDGLEAVSDPVAPYRTPVAIPPVDPKAAAAALHAGIVAYKAGRYDAAVQALQEAAKRNAADPVAWYFLGATRWAQGDRAQALKDYAQGAEREKVSTTPNRALSAALTPIQGAPRDALDRTRP
ncbi:MAG: hypothetical protein ACKODX_10340 [Gemmata sp.]